MWLDGPFDSLHITGVTIRNTFAGMFVHTFTDFYMLLMYLLDGINFHQGVTNCMVEQSIIRNTGDDGLAMWPEQPGTYQNNVYF